MAVWIDFVRTSVTKDDLTLLSSEPKLKFFAFDIPTHFVCRYPFNFYERGSRKSTGKIGAYVG